MTGGGEINVSKLWGKSGESWDPKGRLPYFGAAGYQSGQEPPHRSVVHNVLEFGAVPDDFKEDTDAFQKAVDATQNGALFIPAGRYIIRDVLHMTHGGIVLRGEKGTTLYMDKSLEDVKGPSDDWNSSGGFLWVEAPDESASVSLPVTANAKRGGSSLQVKDADKIKPGSIVYLKLQDKNGSVTLEQELHNGLAWGAHCEWQRPYKVLLVFKVASVIGNRIQFTQPLRMNIDVAWNPQIVVKKTIEEVGIENLSIEFDEVPYTGHNVGPNRNAIYFGRRVVNSWVRNVVVTNADNGIITRGWSSKWITVKDVVLKGRKGHHGLQASSCHDCLFENFRIENEWEHALTLSSHASGTVFSNGESPHVMELDHHRNGPFENLFTQIRTPVRLGRHGDDCAGPAAGARMTYWNLFGVVDPHSLLGWEYSQATYVGRLAVPDLFTEHGAWYENAADIFPVNLYEAQKKMTTTP